MVLGCFLLERFERRQPFRRSDVVEGNLAGIAVEPAVHQARKHISLE